MVLSEEVAWLRYMIADRRHDSEQLSWIAAKGKECVVMYEEDGNELWLSKAESYATLGRSVKGNMFSIEDIRKQRRVVQCLRKQITEQRQS